MRDAHSTPQAWFLRHHDEDDPGLIGAAFERRGFTVEVVDVVGGIAIPAPHPGDVVGVLGSRWSVYDHGAVGAWVDDELGAIRRADELGVGVLGICFGAQALCTALGGRVERAPRGELGWVELDGHAEAGIPAGPWFQYHEDRCVLPAGATALVENDVAIQVYVSGPHLGVQFHPELDAAQLRRWLASGAERDVLDKGVDPSNLVKQTTALEADAADRADSLVGSFLARIP